MTGPLPRTKENTTTADGRRPATKLTIMQGKETVSDNSTLDDILFLGCFCPECEYESIYRNTSGGIQNASDIMQWDYIHGLEHNLGHAIQTATRMSVGVYPFHDKRIYLKTHRFKRENGAFGIAIGFWNTIPVRPFFFNKVGTGRVMKWAERCGGKGVLFAYSSAMAPVVTALKKKYPGIQVVLILPSLPRYTFMDHPNNPAYKLRRRMDEKALKKALEHTDLLVTITKQMGEAIDPEDRVRKIVVDGMIRNCDFTPRETKDSSAPFTIAYTGALTKEHGILDLLSAVERLKDRNLQLVVCGKGEMEQEVKSGAARTPRIVYKGQVTPDTARAVQRDADLLISPGKDDQEYTKYSFPSKILQDMSTGTPVLCCRLSCFAPEYDDHLFYIEPGKDISSAIERIMEMRPEERMEKGQEAARFVIEHKNMSAQTKRILERMRSSPE